MPDDVEARMERAAPGDLERAAQLAPTQSAALVELALGAETRGDLTAARRHLDEAIRRDATFGPRWALLNFLVRHDAAQEALAVAAQAASSYEGDLTGLFDLCLRLGATPDEIHRTIVPPRPHAQREFLVLLLRRGHTLDSVPVALRLADRARPNDRELLVRVCERLLEAGAGAKAAAVWHAMPHFEAMSGRCLDWKRQPAVKGITVIETGEAVVRLQLSGTQPGSALVLRRAMVVEPGRRYSLRTVMDGGDTMRKAVEWRWDGVAVGSGDEAGIEVQCPRDTCELALAVRRLVGERAAEGALEITGIRLEPEI